MNEFEIQNLLEIAKSGGVSSKLTGWQRYTLYATALTTGLRASELASLTPRHFELDAEVPLVHIHAKNEKARCGDVIPLPQELVTVMRSWLLTIGRYTHANLYDLGSAVRQMSPLPLSM